MYCATRVLCSDTVCVFFSSNYMFDNKKAWTKYLFQQTSFPNKKLTLIRSMSVILLYRSVILTPFHVYDLVAVLSLP